MSRVESLGLRTIIFLPGKKRSGRTDGHLYEAFRQPRLIAATSTDDNKALLERIAQMRTKLIKPRRPTE